MLQKTLLFLGIIALIFSGCQKEEDELMSGISDPETQSVTFGISVESEIEQGTDYVPMDSRSLTRATPTRIGITNTCNYIIAKKVGSKLIIEEVSKTRMDPSKSRYVWVDIYEGTSYKCLDVELRPGDYEIFFFTGNNTTRWNESLKRGDLIYDSSAPNFVLPKALEIKADGFWAIGGAKVVSEEIFFGRQTFTVTKTTDLHSYPNTHHVPIELNRRVTKFRIAIKDDPSPSGLKIGDLTQGSALGALIKADITRQDGLSFASGLNVFGNLWYDPDIELKTLKVITMTGKLPYKALDDQDYYISRYQETAFSPYIFTEPGFELPIKTGYIDVSLQQGAPRCVYYDTHDFVIKHNGINGFVLRLTDLRGTYPGEQDPFILEPIYKSGTELLNAADLYESNYEYNYN